MRVVGEKYTNNKPLVNTTVLFRLLGKRFGIHWPSEADKLRGKVRSERERLKLSQKQLASLVAVQTYDVGCLERIGYCSPTPCLKILRYLKLIDDEFIANANAVYKLESIHYPAWVKTEADLEEYIKLLKRHWHELRREM